MLSAKWYNAYRFTESLGVKMPGIPSIASQVRTYIDEQTMALTLSVLKKKYEGQGGEKFLLKCFAVHHLVYHALWNAGVPCYYTLGWVSYAGERLFHNDRQLSDWARNGLPDLNDVPLHCWITFPSGEMVDATISSVISMKNDNYDNFGKIMWGRSEELQDIQYTPTLIGCDALVVRQPRQLT